RGRQRADVRRGPRLRPVRPGRAPGGELPHHRAARRGAAPAGHRALAPGRGLRRPGDRGGDRGGADHFPQPDRRPRRQTRGTEDFARVRSALSRGRAARAQPVARARLAATRLCRETVDLVDRQLRAAHRGERRAAALGGAAAVSAPGDLVAAARAAAGQAYAPYSRFRVGAALRFADGAVVTGSNVENASYGLSLCTETVAVARAFAEGRRGGLVEVAVAASGPGTVTPDRKSTRLN